MRNTLQYPFYVACAEHANRSPQDNAARRAYAVAFARALGVSFEVVHGAYKGAREESLALFGEGSELCARALAIIFNQETYLRIDGHTSAQLLDQYGNIVRVFTRRVAAKADNFTDINGERFTFAE